MSAEVVAELRRAAGCRDPYVDVAMDAFMEASKWRVRGEVMADSSPRAVGAWFLMVAEAIESEGS